MMLTLAATLPLVGRAAAQRHQAPGVSDTEIKIGQTMPYSGPASAYGQLGRVEAAYFAWLNQRGGINGRKITLISVDDGYSPPKAVEQVRKLVEQDEVAAIFNVLGTPNQHGDTQVLERQEGARSCLSQRARQISPTPSIFRGRSVGSQP